MTNPNEPYVYHVPVLNRPGEANYGVFGLFTPVLGRTGIRLLLGFNKPYTPVPPPPPPPGGGSNNVVSLSSYRRQREAQGVQGANNNVVPFRKVA